MEFLIGLLSQIGTEFSAINKAPTIFSGAAIMIAAICMVGARLLYRHQISNLESTIKLKDAEIAQLRSNAKLTETRIAELIQQSFREATFTFDTSGLESILLARQPVQHEYEPILSGGDSPEISGYSDQDDSGGETDTQDLSDDRALLLEASLDSQSGAVPVAGTVDWSEGTDDFGSLTVVGRAAIPSRNLSASILIRKNDDATLPASHILEIDFHLPEGFDNGSVSALAGVLLKNEMLVPGKALAGAAARVVGNSFIFALSGKARDVATNVNLLDSQRWLDIALTYSNGRNAILTLEKTEAAQPIFDRLLAT
jgi:hypothetical protein